MTSAAEHRPDTSLRDKLVAVAVAVFGVVKAVTLFLPKAKFLGSALTMLVSVAVYAQLWGWQFGVGIVALLFLHELGHVLAAKREGIATSAPMFVPFLGALIMLKELPKDAAAEARVGIGGPLLGSAAALVPLALWALTEDPFWQVLAYTGFLLNLFNLVPMVPLDGGRIAAALSDRLWAVGFLALVGLLFVWFNPLLVLILLIGAVEGWSRWRNRHQPEAKAYRQVPPRTRLALGALYVVLLGLLAVGVMETHLDPDLARSARGS